jgi:integrase/recombinase XerC
LAPRSILAYRYDLERFGRWAEASGVPLQRVDSIEPWHLKEYLATLKEDHDLGPNTMCRVISSLRCFFRWLMLEGRIESSPAKGLRNPRKGRKLPLYLTPPEARALAAPPPPEAPDQLRDLTIITLLLMTGIRLSELTGLDRSAVDLESGVIRVLGKGRKERLVPLNRAARAALQRWLAEGPRPAEGCAAVFLNRRGGRISPRTVQYLVRRAVRRLGLDPRLSPHKLRHTFATTLYAEATDLRDIQELLGHANIASTAVYTHTNVDKVRAAVQSLRLG